MKIVITNGNIESFIDDRIKNINEEIQKDPELVKLGIEVINFNKNNNKVYFPKYGVYKTLYSFNIDTYDVEVENEEDEIMGSNVIGYIAPLYTMVIFATRKTNDTTMLHSKIKEIVNKITPKVKNKEIMNTV